MELKPNDRVSKNVMNSPLIEPYGIETPLRQNTAEVLSPLIEPYGIETSMRITSVHRS